MRVSDPLIAIDSPIRIREDLDRQQAAELEAIAVAANVVDVLYRRIVSCIATADTPPGMDELLGDAWGIIDWIHRLDGLVERCRGLSKKLEFVSDYRNASSLVESHRHAIQHLEGTIPAVAGSGRGPWGHMTWTLDHAVGRP